MEEIKRNRKMEKTGRNGGMTLSDVFSRLRSHNRKNYYLYLFCNFISVMLITGYCLMMYSDTVRSVLPVGGDSRKQVMMVFVLTCVGCVAFTIYGAGLFYKMKAREIGIMLTMGISRKQLLQRVLTEVCMLCIVSGVAGLAAGFPFAAGIWQIFKVCIVNTQEMTLHFQYSCLVIVLVFMVFILVAAILTGLPIICGTNIMDVVNSQHKNEMVKEVGAWCGPVGVILLLVGSIFGFLAPSWYMDLFMAYPPAWLSLLYVPAFVGVYMILLHTVVNGWRKKGKGHYKGLVARSMMKFQGKQTVNNMLVITLLIAGAAFALFYVPLMYVSSEDDAATREYPYAFHYRLDENPISRDETKKLAAAYGIALTEWKSGESAVLAMDGQQQIEEGRKFHYEYRERLVEGNFFSQSTYNALTGQNVVVKPGEYYAISDEEETGTYFLTTESTLLTNMNTGDTLPVAFQGFLHYYMLTSMDGNYVISDEDYARISRGNTPQWQENQVFFAVNEDSYEFGKAFYQAYVASMSEKSQIVSGYDRVSKKEYEDRGAVYWGDTEYGEINLKDYESPDFKRNWRFMPKIQIMDKNELFLTYGVFLMMFVFIVIVCLIAAMVIAYIRCLTICINNRYVFVDLKRLGASPDFLKKEIKRQSIQIFLVPGGIGMSAMYLLMVLILGMNDGYLRYTHSEASGLMVCFGMLVGMACVIACVYRVTVGSMKRNLL